jgi:UDP-glucose 6-dehydrogenase
VLGQKIKDRLGTDLNGRQFALWGLAFKPGTDDMPEAASIVVLEDLLGAGAMVHAYDIDPNPPSKPYVQGCKQLAAKVSNVLGHFSVVNSRGRIVLRYDEMINDILVKNIPAQKILDKGLNSGMDITG